MSPTEAILSGLLAACLIALAVTDGGDAEIRAELRRLRRENRRLRARLHRRAGR